MKTLFRREGSILIVCLWLLVVFSLLASALYRISISQMNLSRRLEGRVLSVHAAHTVANYIMWKIKNDETRYDTLRELSYAADKDLGMVKAVYEIVDEEAGININTMPQEVLSRLQGLDEETAKAVFESSFKPFFAEEQLLLIENMNREKLDSLDDFITVHSNGKVNINTARAEVLAALGLDEDLIDIIICYRKGEDGIAATEDDRVFEETGAILSDLQDFTGLFASQELKLLEIISKGWLDVAGENFLLNIKTFVFAGEAMEYDIILNSRKIIQWQER